MAAKWNPHIVARARPISRGLGNSAAGGAGNNSLGLPVHSELRAGPDLATRWRGLGNDNWHCQHLYAPANASEKIQPAAVRFLCTSKIKWREPCRSRQLPKEFVPAGDAKCSDRDRENLAGDLLSMARRCGRCLKAHSYAEQVREFCCCHKMKQKKNVQIRRRNVNALTSDLDHRVDVDVEFIGGVYLIITRGGSTRTVIAPSAGRRG